MSRYLHLPSVHGFGPAAQMDLCGMAGQAARFATAWMAVLGTRQGLMRCDARLVAAAQAHADYLAVRTSEQRLLDPHMGWAGSYANERVLAEEYRLPDYWPRKANNVESLVSGTADVEYALRLLLESPSHRVHLLGEGWFAGHTVYGIGERDTQFVIVSAPEE